MANTINPIINVDRPFTVWPMAQIFTGKPGSTGRYAPNVDDLVFSYETGWWRCIAMDPETGYSTIVSWNLASLSGGINQTDVIVGGGQGTASEFYRIYVNTKTVPYSFSIDTRLRIYGSAASYIKIFKENNITGTPISAIFNSSGAMVSENITLETVAIPNVGVNAIKTPKQGYLTEKLENGDIVSVAIYSNSGAVLSVFKLIVVNTNFVRTIDSAKKLIVDISLLSPYQSATDSSVLEYPANMTIDTGSLMGRVTYNDGSTQVYPVGPSNSNAKFKLLGIENYVTTQLGQTVPIILSYSLSEGEYANVVKQVGIDRFMNKTYRLITVDSDNLYSVRLYVVPYWDNAKSQWRLEYYLTNLNRDYIYRVTPYIEYGTNTTPFDGTSPKWGVTQKLTVAVNLDKVAPSFKYYRHVQSFNLTLHQAGSNTTYSGYYTIEYDNDSVYTKITACDFVNTPDGFTINISGNRTNAADWLYDTYKMLEPLYIPYVETYVPQPTHIRIIIGDNWVREVPLNAVLKDITGINAPIATGTLVRLEYIGNYSSTRMILATSGMIAKPRG